MYRLRGMTHLGRFDNTGPISRFFRRLVWRLHLNRLHPAIACWCVVDWPQPPATDADRKHVLELAAKYGWML